MTIEMHARMRRSIWDCTRNLVLGLTAALLFLVAGRLAHATEPARVHVVLHTRGAANAPVTFVDISVQGTDAPIRIVRRVEGACTVAPDGGEGALALVSCASAPAIRFEVSREGDVIFVRRESPADADAGASPDERVIQVIARATLPAGADVHVE
jgi:hypothetical protein